MMSPTNLAQRYRELRARTVELLEPLSAEDQMVQAFDYASPAKWHLAHTTWFFDTLIAQRHSSWRPRHDWGRLFNSYYESLGDPFPQKMRGLLSRPSLVQVREYRDEVDAVIFDILNKFEDSGVPEPLQGLLLTGINHEEQHQELLLTDLLANFSLHPEAPVIFPSAPELRSEDPGDAWTDFDQTVAKIGACEGFYFDHEFPQHERIVYSFSLSNRLVSNQAMQDFIADRGYENPELWLSAGIEWVRKREVKHPRYWRKRDGQWCSWTLYGERPLDPNAPVLHINGYEADALATWLGARLPTEFEWEHAAAQGPGPQAARWLGQGPVLAVQPLAAALFGEAWVWTRSAYLPYPGYVPREGAVGEYNGKFMSDRWVLRGGSCATPPGHLRASYRNFFDPAHNWQFSGLRLARDR